MKQDVLSETVKSPPSDLDHVSLPSAQSQPAGVTPGSLPSQVSLNDAVLTIPNSMRNVSACDIPVGSQDRPIPEKACKINKTNDLILNLTPENVTQHSRIE